MSNIIQSLYNLLTTIPGQKLLNPAYGLNLSHYCFEPINNVTSDHIARSLLIEVPKFEPRIQITNLNVVGHRELSEYHITFGIHVPDYETDILTIKGIVNSDGFKFVT